MMDEVMKQWFPFTDYDFYAYLTAGMVFIAACDYSLAGQVLIDRSEWTLVQIVFWTAVAYLAGQLLAAPSSALLEHFVVRTVLRPPIAIQLGLIERRWRERVVAFLFANREYAPLPKEIRGRIIERAAKALDVEIDSLSDPEAIFGVAYLVARRSEDAVSRMDQFRNLYGFSRNISFVGLLAAGIIGYRYWQSPAADVGYFLFGSLLLAIGMFGRFVKFYAAFGAEVLRAFGTSESVKEVP
jgi:hypothetical protein